MTVDMWIGLATPVALVFIAILAFSVWQQESRRRYRRFSNQDELERRKFQAEQEAATEERELRWATLVPEDYPRASFTLTISSDDPFVAVRIVAAFQELYVEHGFERPEIESVERGSVKIKMRARIAAFFGDARTKEMIEELRIAAEEATVGRVVSENNERNANAAATVMEAMSGADEVEYRSPGLIVRKTTDSAGRVQIQAIVPDSRELARLKAQQLHARDKLILETTRMTEIEDLGEA